MSRDYRPARAPATRAYYVVGDDYFEVLPEGWTKPAWLDEAMDVLLRAAEGGAFDECPFPWGSPIQSPRKSPARWAAERASEILGRRIGPTLLRRGGSFDNERPGWAEQFWQAVFTRARATADPVTP